MKRKNSSNAAHTGSDALQASASRICARTVLPPRSKPGDSLEMRAEMDLIVGLTACSAELSNNYAFKPIDFEVTREAPE